MQKKYCGGERKVEGYAQLSQERTQQYAVSRNKTGGGRKPDSPKGTTVKIIQLFEDDPSFNGISGGTDSGKSLLC